jgi:hypothetical protein
VFRQADASIKLIDERERDPTAHCVRCRTLRSARHIRFLDSKS